MFGGRGVLWFVAVLNRPVSLLPWFLSRRAEEAPLLLGAEGAARLRNTQASRELSSQADVGEDDSDGQERELRELVHELAQGDEPLDSLIHSASCKAALLNARVENRLSSWGTFPEREGASGSIRDSGGGASSLLSWGAAREDALFCFDRAI